MAKSKQFNVEVEKRLLTRLARDAKTTGRSLKTITAVALREFYNRPIPEREALLLREAPNRGRKTAL